MAYRNDFISVTLSGTLASGNEIWSCGYHIDSATNPQSTADLQSWAEGGGANVVGFSESLISDPDVMVPQGVRLTEVKIAVRDTSGATVGEPAIYPCSAYGAATGGYAPQNALVNTLVSAKPRAPGRYNRFYLPISVSGLLDGYKLSPSQQDLYSARIVEYIDQVNLLLSTAFPGDSVKVSVLSDAGTGWNLSVDNVMLGQIVDTQQRRRNKLPENYFTQPVTP